MEYILGKDVHEKDNLLDGFTFEGIITALHCGEPVINEKVVRKVVLDNLHRCIQDLNHLVDINMDEIIKRALAGRDE
jgi:hypothetical protein